MSSSNTPRDISDGTDREYTSFTDNLNRRKFLGATAGSLLLSSGLGTATATDDSGEGPVARDPTARGYGGAAASLDPRASQTAIDILGRGGNAIDAAIAASATLGVVRPYDGSIGGGGYMVIYLANQDETVTIDARSMAPKSFDPDEFIELPFSERVTGPLSSGVPGLVRGWETALLNYGTMHFQQLLQPAITIANDGFVADQAYVDRTENNAELFEQYISSADLYLTDDLAVPTVGDQIRNQDLARTYQMIYEDGPDVFYEGDIANVIVETLQNPPVAPDGDDQKIRAGEITVEDLAAYESRRYDPVVSSYRGYNLHGIGASSTGAATVGQVLNILEGYDIADFEREQALHYFLEASRIAFADREAFIGPSPDFPDAIPVSEYPIEGILSEEFAAERRELIDESAFEGDYSSGSPYEYQEGESPLGSGTAESDEPPETSTTHLSVSDSEGNIVSFTFTIVSIGGSGVAIPGYGFLANNVLIGSVPPAEPNDRGGRPYSNTAPTIVFGDGEPLLTVGSPGGANIISTVIQLLINTLDFGKGLPEAIASPRVSNTTPAIAGSAEDQIFDISTGTALEARGHGLSKVGAIGNANGIEFCDDSTVQAAAEPDRLGGGSAIVENTR